MKKIKKNLAILKKTTTFAEQIRKEVLIQNFIERRVAGVVNGAVC